MGYLRAKAITTQKWESELQDKIMKNFLIKRGWRNIGTMPLHKFFKLYKQESNSNKCHEVEKKSVQA